jgi:HTH-type transcriptional regulator / antitoxin HigA
MDIHPIRPIRTDVDHKAALREIEALWGAPEGSAEADRLDVLATLVDVYENERWPVADSDPIDILHYLIDEQGRTQAELGDAIGSRSRASEILARKRALTIEMIDKISKAWRIPRGLLVAPYALKRAATPKKRAAKRLVPRRRRVGKRAA